MSDERITDLILQRLENIERKIDGIQAQGCSKAEGHLRMQANEAELFSRMNALESAGRRAGQARDGSGDPVGGERFVLRVDRQAPDMILPVAEWHTGPRRTQSRTQTRLRSTVRRGRFF